MNPRYVTWDIVTAVVLKKGLQGLIHTVFSKVVVRETLPVRKTPSIKPEYRRSMSSRRRKPAEGPRLTHFLCLPILTSTSIPQLKLSLAHLKASIPSTTKPTIVQDAEGRSWKVDQEQPLFPDGALRPLGTLHLTLGVLSLVDKERLQRAKELLKSFDLAQCLRAVEQQSISTKGESSKIPANNDESTEASLIAPLAISLEGLFEFKPSAKMTRLLARPVDHTNRLAAFGTAVRQHFVDAELMTLKPHEKELTLHGTLVNTLYAEKTQKRIVKFDGRQLIGLFEDKGGGQTDDATGPFLWAKDIEINRVQICEMGAKKVEGEMGQKYNVEAEKLILPET
ncbi:MAG: hypothetical protein Q9160_003991 [Pyrenula sp. 1 TL-2023]